MTHTPDIPTTERLAQALTQAGAPAHMIEQAQAGYYDDYESPLAMNITALVGDARAAGLDGIAARAADGEFDATKAESDAWAASPEGQETFRSLLGDSAHGGDR